MVSPLSRIRKQTSFTATIPPRMAIGPIQLLRQATTEQRRRLLAAALGWMLDAFDAMLYALVLARAMRDLGMPKVTAGLLCTLPRKVRSPHCLRAIHRPAEPCPWFPEESAPPGS
jgi:hypothetical protein